MRVTHPNYGLESPRKLFATLFALAVAAKAVLATITPLSFDFVNIMYGALWVSQGATFHGPYTFSVNFMYLFYRLWLLLPVDHNWIYSGYSFIPSPNSFLLLFMFKLPLLVLDVLTSLLIYKLVQLFRGDQRISRVAALIWLFNPYLTVVTEMDGTVDIISTFLVVLATYLYVRERHVFSGICLALATAARFYPIALIPFYAIFLLKERKIRSLLLMIASYFVLLALILIRFIASYGMSFLNTLYMLPSGGNKEFTWFFGFRPNVASTSGIEISSVVTVLAVMALLAMRSWKNDRRLVLDLVLIALVTYVGLSHFNRYYTVWVTPFLTVDLAINWNSVYRNIYRALYVLFFLSAFVYNGSYWWFNSLLFIHEFTPQMAEMAAFIRGVGSMLRAGELGTTFSQSILAGTCILYAAMLALRNSIRSDGQQTSLP